MLKSKIFHLKEIYNFDLDHFLIKCTVFYLIVKNVIKNPKFNFPDKLCYIKKNVKKQNCSFQKDLQILFWPFFDKTHGFCFNQRNVVLKIKSCGFRSNNARYEKML